MVKRFRTRRGPKTRQSRKMGVKRASRIMSRKKRVQRKQNLDTFAVSAKVTYLQKPVWQNGSANIQGIVPFLSNSPGQPLTPNMTKEYNIYCKMYDQVRFNRCTVRVRPCATDLGWATASGTKGDFRLHTAIDRNSAPTSDLSSILQYPSYKSFSAVKPFKRSMAIKWPAGVWLDTENVFTDPVLLNNLGCSATIGLFAQGLPFPSTQTNLPTWAELEVTYHMVFRGRKSTNVVANTDGSVTIQPMEHFKQPLVQSGYTIVAGTILDGATDDEDISQQQE